VCQPSLGGVFFVSDTKTGNSSAAPINSEIFANQIPALTVIIMTIRIKEHFKDFSFILLVLYCLGSSGLFAKETKMIIRAIGHQTQINIVPVS